MQQLMLRHFSAVVGLSLIGLGCVLALHASNPHAVQLGDSLVCAGLLAVNLSPNQSRRGDRRNPPEQ
jgi:hypothetical protein